MVPWVEKETKLTHPIVFKEINVSPKLVTFPKGPFESFESMLFWKQEVIKQDPSVEAEAHTLLVKGSKQTLMTLDLWSDFLPPIYHKTKY